MEAVSCVTCQGCISCKSDVRKIKTPEACHACEIYSIVGNCCKVTYTKISLGINKRHKNCPLVVCNETWSFISRREVGIRDYPPEVITREMTMAYGITARRRLLNHIADWKAKQGCIANMRIDPTENCQVCEHGGSIATCPVRKKYRGYGEYREAMGNACSIVLSELDAEYLSLKNS